MITYKELLEKQEQVKIDDQFGFKGKQYPTFLVTDVGKGKLTIVKYSQGKQEEQKVSIMKFMNQKDLYKMK